MGIRLEHGWIPTSAPEQSASGLIRDLQNELDILRKNLTATQEAGNKSVEARRKAEEELAKESEKAGQLQTEVDALNVMIDEAKASLYQISNTSGDIATRAKGASEWQRHMIWRLDEAEEALDEAKKTTVAWLPVMQFCCHNTLPLHCGIDEAYRRYVAGLKYLVGEIPLEHFPTLASTEKVLGPSIRPKRYVAIRCGRCGDTVRKVSLQVDDGTPLCNLYQCTSCCSTRWIERRKIRRVKKARIDSNG